jgi:hypothetical protein
MVSLSPLTLALAPTPFPYVDWRSKIDHSLKLDKSIREKSIQSFIVRKFCRLNSGHPAQSNLLEHTTHSIFHHLTPPVGGPVRIFERTVFERTNSSQQIEAKIKIWCRQNSTDFTPTSHRMGSVTGRPSRTGTFWASSQGPTPSCLCLRLDQDTSTQGSKSILNLCIFSERLFTILTVDLNVQD